MDCGDKFILYAQIICYVATMILSLGISIPIILHTRDFRGHCLLFTTGHWSEDTGQFIASWSTKAACVVPILVGFLIFISSLVQLYKTVMFVRQDSDSPELNLLPTRRRYTRLLLCGRLLSAFTDVIWSVFLTLVTMAVSLAITFGFRVWCGNMLLRFESKVMDCFPDDIYIELFNYVTWKDVLSVGRVSRVLNKVSNLEPVWRKQCFKRWGRSLFPQETPRDGWKNKFEEIHDVVEAVLRHIDLMGASYNEKRTVQTCEFEYIDSFLNASPDYAAFIEKDLKKKIIGSNSSNEHLWKSYYTFQAYAHVVHRRLLVSLSGILRRLSPMSVPEPQEFPWRRNFHIPEEIEVEKEELTLEAGFSYMAQWLLPLDESVQLDTVNKWLDSKAKEVMTKLSEDSGQIDVLLAISEMLFSDDITPLFADPCNQDFDVYERLGLHRTNGIPMTEFVIYHGIARRLGIDLEVVHSHMFYHYLRWKMYGHSGSESYFYIAPHFKGEISCVENVLPRYIQGNPEQILTKSSFLQVWRTMLHNLSKRMAWFCGLEESLYKMYLQQLVDIIVF